MLKLMFFQAGERVVVKDIAVPEYKSSEILVKLVAATACGSDLVPWSGHHGSKTEGLAAGHEGVGVIAAGESLLYSMRSGF